MGSSSTSGQTMMNTHSDALHDRLAQLQAMQQRKGFKKKSFDIKDSKKLSRSQSNANRDRYHSIATTKKTELNKIKYERQQQREQVVKQQNRRMKQYIKSRKNLFDTDDEKKLTDNDDAAIALNDEQLSKVDNDGDTQLSETPLSPAPSSETTADTDTDSKTSDQQFHAKSQQSKPVIYPQKTPIANPSVAVSSNLISSTKRKSNSSTKRNSGFLGNLFKKKDSQSNTNDN